MRGGLPEHIDPLHLADAGVQLAGDLPVARLGRLKAMLASEDASVRLTARFGMDEQGRRVLKLEATAELEMTCQRCMGRMAVPVAVDATLELVPEDAAGDTASERYEPLFVSRGHMSLAEIVEDELLLQLPMIPRHEPGNGACLQVAGPADGQEQDQARENPFAVLATLKDRQ